MPSDDACPHCGADLQGEPIPPEHIAKGWYGNATHGSRRIGIYSRERDRTVEWLCPDCGGRWPR